MQRSIPYSKHERRVVDERPGFFGGPGIPVYNTPVNPRENTRALYYDKKPYWLPGGFDTAMVHPDLYNTNLGRGRDISDAFGRFWEFEATSGGSITRGGNPLFTDANEWKDKVIIPNIDEWDWAKAAEDTKIDTRFAPIVSLVNGFWFERLISFMDFENAAIALVDEEQQDAVMELFQALTDLGCRVIDKMVEHFPSLDGINVHDDWGSQKAPFFSEEIARKLFLPFMKQICNHIHSKGRYTSLHSCGHVEDRVELFIEAGFEEWQPQTMNNTRDLWERYGDRIIVGVSPDPVPEGAPEEVYRQAARDFVDRFAVAGKPCTVGFSPAGMNPAFSEELYEYSRKKFASM
ncbi:MAG: methyltransferase [Eubacteriaceae bacterium]|nr:methyltransferase [Eubacteriaceae bacterium]